jgi:hypothetical protein
MNNSAYIIADKWYCDYDNSKNYRVRRNSRAKSSGYLRYLEKNKSNLYPRKLSKETDKRKKMYNHGVFNGDYSFASKWEQKLDTCYEQLELLETKLENCELFHPTNYTDLDIKKMTIHPCQKNDPHDMYPPSHLLDIRIHLYDGKIIDVCQQTYIWTDQENNNKTSNVYGNISCPVCDNQCKSTTYSCSEDKVTGIAFF